MYNHKSKIASQLVNYESPIQLSSEWERLEKRLRKEKKRRLLLILLPLSIGAAIATIYLFNTQSQDNLTSSGKDIVFKNTQKSSIPFVKYNAAISDDKSHIHNGQKINTNEINIQKQEKINSHITISPYLLKTSSNQATKQNSKENNNLPTSYESLKNNNSEENNITSQTQTIFKEVTSPKEIIASEDTKALEINAAIANEATSLPADINPIFISPLSLLYPNLNHENEVVDALTIKPIISKERNKIWLDASMSIGQSIIKYTDIAPEAKQLVSLKKSAEKPLENLQWNISAAKFLNYGFYIKSGLQYNRMNDLITTSLKDTSTTLIPNSIIGVYTNHEGLVQNTYGTLKKITISEKEITKYGNAQTLNITMLLGKNFEIQKSKWCIEVGAGLPIWTAYKGQALAGFNQLRPKSDVYNNDKAWSFISSLHHQYPLSKFLYLSGGYTFTYHKLSTNLDYSNTTSVHSCTVGLRYFIN